MQENCEFIDSFHCTALHSVFMKNGDWKMARGDDDGDGDGNANGNVMD